MPSAQSYGEWARAMKQAVFIQCGSWAALGKQALQVRQQVFVQEQKVPAELELDEWDERCWHALALNKQQQAIGTGRLLPDGHIGRMAVLATARGKGVGTLLLKTLMQYAGEQGHQEVMLNSQLQAAAFYRRLGFKEEGKVFEEAGIPHIAMRCFLQK